ncbi:MAG: MaoC family dehydratase [Clostridiales bacterium]|jgi:3-hydroxybutyryl-CoA dehydratase|nr:MaoC family dehydratase [Eubacteriales bacterium]MDH7567670.1 MaoC family dehydratase [Clostridiales bacterium]
MPEADYNSIKPGDSYILYKQITEDMVRSFADFTGDYNPVHIDDSYCKEHGLDSRIVHGMLTISFLSTFIGMHLPGNGAVWLSQRIDFIAPVKIGDTIKIHGTVIKKDSGNVLGLNIVTIKFRIFNQLDKMVVRGTVKVSVK